MTSRVYMLFVCSGHLILHPHYQSSHKKPKKASGESSLRNLTLEHPSLQASTGPGGEGERQ